MSYELWKVHKLNVVINEQLELVRSLNGDDSTFANMSRCGAWNEIGLKIRDRNHIINGEWDGRSPCGINNTIYERSWDYGKAWGNYDRG